jgi:hypothetical protein
MIWIGVVHLPSSAEVENAWSYTSTPAYVMAWCLVKHRDNLTFTLTPHFAWSSDKF